MIFAGENRIISGELALLGLTREQREQRRLFIGGSDAARIVSGDWHSLWLEKTNQRDGEDLSQNFAVQLGNATENLNLAWYELKTGRVLSRLGEQPRHSMFDFLGCTLDGFDAALPAVVQAKHVNAYSKMEEVIQRYTPQVTHEMLVCGVSLAMLSVIVGTNEPVVTEIVLDEFYGSQYIDQCRRFWGHVMDGTEPEQGKPLPPPAPVEAFRTVDMSGNNEWASLAADWVENQKAAKRFEIAAKGLKGMVEPDVGLAFGHGVQINRDKRGLRIGASK